MSRNKFNYPIIKRSTSKLPAANALLLIIALIVLPLVAACKGEKKVERERAGQCTRLDGGKKTNSTLSGNNRNIESG